MRKFYNPVLILGVLAVSTSLSCASSQTSSVLASNLNSADLPACVSDKQLDWASNEIEFSFPKKAVLEAGVFPVRVKFKKCTPKKVEVELLDSKFLLYPEDSSSFGGLAPIKYGTKIKKVPVLVHFDVVDKSGVQAKKAGPYTVSAQPRKFRSEKLTVPPSTVTPSPEDQKRIDSDKALVGQVYAKLLEEKMWKAPAILPIDSAVTAEYGKSRVYNGKKSGLHLGTDLRAAVGTPVKAMMSGKVVLSRELFLTGNTVILSHGYGLFSVYAHFSKTSVSEGAVVSKGDVLGESGATGRVSGPHLHWGVRLHGNMIDPELLVKVSADAGFGT